MSSVRVLLVAAIVVSLAACQTATSSKPPPESVAIDQSGNPIRPPGAIGAPPTTAQPATARKGASSTKRIAGLNRGAMATFVVQKSPQDLPDLTFVNAKGKPVSLRNWRGRVVLVNLWAVWCAPCRKALPGLNRLKAKVGKKDFDVVTISVDKGKLGPAKKALRRAKVKGLKFYGDPSGGVVQALRTKSLPMAILVDRDGREIGRATGFAKWDSPDGVKLVKAAVKTPS